MRRALVLARQGVGRVNPNPLVGAVVVRGGEVVGEGAHQEYGGPHAEVAALAQAGARARGADLYVNCEPCVAYPGKLTPPCVDRILQSGLRRVFIGALDPNPRVHGRGVARLRRAGLEVHVGVLGEEARRLNEISHVYYTEGRPFVCLKWAMTLDGKIASRTGEARWVSGEASRRRVHELRNRYAAVLVGVDTVIRDDPQLTVRSRKGRDPWRFILDSKGRTPLDAQVLRLESPAPTVIATTEAMPNATERALLRRGARVRVWRLPDRQGKVHLEALLVRMARQRLDSLLVEGGGRVHWSFLTSGLFDKVICFIAPKLIGGRDAPTAVGGEGFAAMSEAIRLEEVSVERLGDDLCCVAYGRRQGPRAPAPENGPPM